MTNPAQHDDGTRQAPAFTVTWPSLTSLSATIKAMFPIVATVGGILVLRYFGEAGHFPLGATVADILLSLATAIVSTTIYVLFVLSAYGAGLALLAPLVVVVNFCKRRSHMASVARHRLQADAPVEKFPNLEGSEWLLAIAALLLTALLAPVFWAKNPLGLVGLLAYIVFIALVRLTYLSQRRKGGWGGRANRDRALLLALIVFVVPLATDLFAGLDILTGTMRLIGVRKENATLFVSNARAVLIDAEDGNGQPRETFGDYHRYENAVVVMRGIGTESVIEIHGHRWVMPNDQFVISYQPKISQATATR